MSANRLVSVIGGHACDRKTARLAEKVGACVARQGAVLICGGLTGVMEHAAKGAREAGGLTIGILPGIDKRTANRYINIALPTGLGYARNVLVAGASDVVIALAGKEGTLSEIGFALSSKKPVLDMGAWRIAGTVRIRGVAQLRATLSRLLKAQARGG